MLSLLVLAAEAEVVVRKAPGITQVISPYMAVFVVAFLASFILTPVMRVLAVRNGIVDKPDEQRKAHRLPVAYLGGVAIFLGWLIGVGVSYTLTPHNVPYVEHSLGFVDFPISVIIGAGAIVITGLFDDVWKITPQVKIGGQIMAAAALAMERVGIRLVEQAFQAVNNLLIPIPSPDWLIYILGAGVIVVFVIGGCNAVNLLDGLDGLAAGTSAIACFGFLMIAAVVATRTLGLEEPSNVNLANDAIRLIMCLAILGALLGFLPYNFNPATIFMGDAGSLLVGYLCVSTMLLFAYETGNGLLLVSACLIVFAVPITDTSLAIFRRKLQGKPISAPDDQHIHHLLRRAGLSVKQSVLLIYSLSGVFAFVGFSMVALNLPTRYLLAAAMVLFGFVIVTAYKYGQRHALDVKEGRLRHQPPVPEAPAREADGPLPQDNPPGASV